MNIMNIENSSVTVVIVDENGTILENLGNYYPKYYGSINELMEQIKSDSTENGSVEFLDFENIPDSLITENSISNVLWNLLEMEDDVMNELVEAFNAYGSRSINSAKSDLKDSVINNIVNYIMNNDILIQDIVEQHREGGSGTTNNFYFDEFVEEFGYFGESLYSLFDFNELFDTATARIYHYNSYLFEEEEYEEEEEESQLEQLLGDSLYREDLSKPEENIYVKYDTSVNNPYNEMEGLIPMLWDGGRNGGGNNDEDIYPFLYQLITESDEATLLRVENEISLDDYYDSDEISEMDLIEKKDAIIETIENDVIPEAELVDIARLFEIFEVPNMLSTFSGYSQGDAIETLGVWTPSYGEITGVSMDSITDDDIYNQLKYFSKWVFGDTFMIGKYDPENDDFDWYGGIIGEDDIDENISMYF